MGGVIDLLAAEVPGIEPEGASIGYRELMTVDVNAASGFVFSGQVHIGPKHATEEASFPGPAFADDQQFGFQ